MWALFTKVFFLYMVASCGEETDQTLPYTNHAPRKPSTPAHEWCSIATKPSSSTAAVKAVNGYETRWDKGIY